MAAGTHVGRGWRSSRVGAALVAVVLLTLALFALGHGLLALSLGELAASKAAVRYLEARAAADAAVHRTMAGPGSQWMDSVAVGEARVSGAWRIGRADASVTIRRLAAEAWLVEGVGRLGAAELRTARLAWALDPIERILALDGALTVGANAPLTIDGTIDTTAPAAVEPPMTDTDCAPWVTQVEASYLSAPLAPVALLVEADTLLRLGLLDVAAILAEVDVMIGGVGTPEPVESLGVCSGSEPWNWGDPERPWRPCGELLALRGSAGSVVVDGGAGQGLFVVEGDLTLVAGAHLFGLVVATGALRLEDGAALDGMAIALGGVHLAPGTSLRASACWATRALAAQRATVGRLRALPGVGEIGPL